MNGNASSFLPDMTLLKQRLLHLWRAGGRETPVPGLVISCEEAPRGPIHSVYQPSFCAVLQGAKTSRLGDRAFHYKAGHYLIASVEVPIRAQIVQASAAEPYMSFSLSIDPEVVAALMLEQAMAHDEAGLPNMAHGGLVHDHRVEDSAHTQCSALGVAELNAGLIDPLCRLLALPDHPQDIPVLAPLIRREIVWRLLNGQRGGMLRQIGLADSRLGRIKRAIAHIRDHFAEPLSIATLASHAGMSPATFHRHFKAVTAMTPVQYQKQIRLQEARRLLLAEGVEVARVGFTIGYDSPSQFSREYRRLFGESPGRDGARIRRDLLSGRAA